MKPTLLVISIAAAALALGGAAAGAPGAARATAVTSYTDPSGDSGAAPDVTNVDVATDLVTGAIVFWIDTPNRTTLGGGDEIDVYIDTDSSVATGDPDNGAEYVIEFVGSSSSLFRWNGSDYVGAPSASLSAAYFENVKAARIEVHPSGIGGATAFTFFIFTFAGEATDDAPDGEFTWQYAPRAERFQLTVAAQSIRPNPPRAGSPLTVAIRFGRPDLNEFHSRGTIACTLKVGGRTLRATTRTVRDGWVTCVWRLPSSAKGKRVTGSVRLTFGGATAQRAFSLKAR